MKLNRRRMLKGLAGLAGAGVAGRFALLPPSPSRDLEPTDVLARRFFESLDADDRARACVEYDHPLRQYHNRGVWGGGLWVNPLNLGWDQRRMMTDLFHGGLSQAGRARVPEEYYTRFPGVHSMHVLMCGDPRKPPYQLILTGAHLNLRIGGASREGIAFGGPLVYGDQSGDDQPGLPGNLYRYQLEIAQRLFGSLSSEQRALALRKTSPVQTDIQLQGAQGVFEGVPVSSLTSEGRAAARELAGAMLSSYPDADVAYAWECLERNGGVEQLRLAFYEDSVVTGGSAFQNVRLEGPAAVLYFRGHPHVHAFVNVGRDPEVPLSVGELLANNPAPLRGAQIKQLFETALRDELGTDLAYFDTDSVAGSLRAGPVRSGDVYALEVWQDRAVVAELEGSELSPHFAGELRARGFEADPRRTYSVATTAYASGDAAPERLGKLQARQMRAMVRDVLIAQLRRRGFAPTG